MQHVDVCMFSNGKFKNVVALLSSQEGCPLGPGASMKKTYTLKPIKGSTKNWIALEDSYTKAEAMLASTVICPGNGPEDRNVFAIYVSYYVKVNCLYEHVEFLLSRFDHLTKIVLINESIFFFFDNKTDKSRRIYLDKIARRIFPNKEK